MRVFAISLHKDSLDWYIHFQIEGLLLITHILPQHGNDGSQYLAIEATRCVVQPEYFIRNL